MKVDALGLVVELTKSKRSWPMTELIKAHIAQARAGLPGAEEKAAEAIDLLFEYFLKAQVAGSYIDQRGINDQIVDASAQASTLYHLVVACTEVVDYCEQ